jgi:hypothetical protein
MMMKPAVQVAEEAALQLENDGIAEGPLGLLFLDLVPSASGSGDSTSSIASVQGTNSKSSLAQRLKDMANVPLAALKKVIDDDVDPDVSPVEKGHSIDEEAHEKTLQSNKSAMLQDSHSNKQLVSDVMEVMQQQQLELLELALEKEREEEVKAREKERIARGNISIEGHFDKKSPAHNMWQVCRFSGFCLTLFECSVLHLEPLFQACHAYRRHELHLHVNVV